MNTRFPFSSPAAPLVVVVGVVFGAEDIEVVVFDFGEIVEFVVCTDSSFAATAVAGVAVVQEWLLLLNCHN